MGKLTDIDWNFWNFFADVARLKELAKSGDADARKGANEELMQMCIWEYARECQPLRDAISGLHDAVGNLLLLGTMEQCAPETLKAIETGKIPLIPLHRGVLTVPGSKQFRAQTKATRAQSYRDFEEKWKKHLKAAEAIARDFNWHFLCSPEFPGRPWIDPGSTCRIKKSTGLFLDRAGLYPKPTEVMVQHGRGERPGLHQELPMPARFSGNFADYFDNGDRAVLDELQEFILKLITEQYEDFGQTAFELWAFPHQMFEIYEPDDLAKGLRRLCHLREPHRLVPNDLTQDQLKREHPAAYLRWLGVMRFFHIYDRFSREDTLKELRESDASRDKEAARVLAPFVEGKVERDGEARWAATDFYRKLLKQPGDARPISYDKYPKESGC